MPVIYDSKKIIPAPFISIRREVNRSTDGIFRGSVFVISVKGKLVAYKGSPNSSGTFHTGSGYPTDETIAADSRLASMIAKQHALIKLFKEDNKFFEVQPYDGTAPFKALTRLRAITFEEGNWFDICNYSIELEADKVWFGNNEVSVDDAAPEESWSIELADEKFNTYRLQHTITATGKADYDDNGNLERAAWEVARDIIKEQSDATIKGAPFLGIDSDIYGADSIVDLSTHTGYNYVRGQQIDEASGKYTVTESWVLYDPSLTGGIACLEEYNINVRRTEEGLFRASIEGTITGLEERNNSTHALTKTRWENAKDRWDNLRTQLFSIVSANVNTIKDDSTNDGAGVVTMNTEPLSKSEGKNKLTGVITFSREYDNRPTPEVAGSISTSVQVNESEPTDIFASLVVLGKKEGPVLQDIGTVTARKRTVAIELVVKAANMENPNPIKPDVQSIVDDNEPDGSNVFKDRDENTWNKYTGRYSRQVSWTWTD